MNKRILFCLLLLISFVAYGCGVGQSGGGVGRSYFPDTDGLTWHYLNDDGAGDFSNSTVTIEGTTTCGTQGIFQKFFSTYYPLPGGASSTGESFYRVTDARGFRIS